MVAAAGLGYYSYRSAMLLRTYSEASVERSNRALGLKLVDRVEKVVIDHDRTLFGLVRLDDPREFRALWQRILRVSPAVASVIVVREGDKVEHLLTTLRRRSRRAFRKFLPSVFYLKCDLSSSPLASIDIYI